MIEVKPFRYEKDVPLDGLTLKLVVDFQFINRIEALLGRDLGELIGEIHTSLSLMVKFAWAMTRENHNDLNMDQIAGLVLSPEQGPAICAMIGDLIKTAFRLADEPKPAKRKRAKAES